MHQSLFDSMDFSLDEMSIEEDVHALIEEHEEDDPGGVLDELAGWSRLDADARQRRASIRTLVTNQLLPDVAEAFLEGRFPRSLFRELGNAGALGAGLAEHDAHEVQNRMATLGVMHSLEWGDGGLRCAVTIQDSVIQALVRYGDDQQRARWLPSLRSGEAVASFGLTEPQAGSDVRALSTRAVRRGRDWVLSGTKGWVTNAPVASILLIWARTGERNDAIRGFLVEPDALGVTVEPIRHAASLRVATVGRVTLDGTVVSNEALLPHAWGLSDINACLDYNRMTVAFGAIGAARFCLETAIRRARDRWQFGVPIATKQLIQGQVTDMATKVVLGELLALHIAERWQHLPLSRLEVSLLKRNNCAAARSVALAARSILGAHGIDLDNHVARHLLNVEASYSYGGTHEIHGLVVARSLLGVNAF